MMTEKAKSTTIEKKPKLIGFSFYHKGKEYIIQAVDQKEARILFNELITKHGKRDRTT